MKHFSCIIILLCLLSSCKTNQSSCNIDFKEVERLISLFPDSALQMLDQYNPNLNCFSKSERVLFHLLHTEALYKTYRTLNVPECDSLMDVVIEYYGKEKDYDHLARAWYCKGGILDEKNEPLLAQESYMNALKHEADVSDCLLLEKLNNHVGSLYNYQGLYEQAVEYLSKAKSYAYIAEDRRGKAYVNRDLARAFDSMGRLDSAIFYYEQSLPFAKEAGAVTTPSELGGLYLKTGSRERAYSLLKMAESWTNKEESLNAVSLVLGRYFRETNEQDSAEYYFKRAIRSSSIHTKAGGYKELRDIELIRGNMRTALDYMCEYSKWNDSIQKIMRTESLYKINALYDYQKLKEDISQQKLKVEQGRSRLRLMFILIISTFSLFYLCFLYWRKKRERERQTMKSRELSLMSEMEYLKKDNEEKVSKIETGILVLKTEKELLDSKIQDLNNVLSKMGITDLSLCRQLAENEDNKRDLMSLNMKNTDAFRRFYEISDTRQATSKEWRELERDLNVTCNGFVKELRKIMPNMSASELQTCMLVKIGMPTSKINNLIGYKNSSILQCRLYAKMTQSGKGTVKEFVDYIKSL